MRMKGKLATKMQTLVRRHFARFEFWERLGLENLIVRGRESKISRIYFQEWRMENRRSLLP